MSIVNHEDVNTINISNTIKQTKGRLYYIDFLKCIGLTGIIIAHVGSPSWVMMLRSFDVPLMVILSSILANRSYSKYSSSKTSVIDYYMSRIKRLVIPTWVFLTFYFVFKYIVTGSGESVKYYLASFLLTRYGIGYVWVILIYLYSAMLIPLFAKFKLSIKGVVIVVISYVIYEIAYHYGLGLNGGMVQYFVDSTFYYIIPYGLITYLGYNYNKMTAKAKYVILLTSSIAFISLAIYYWADTGTFQLVQIAKYPPRLYYLSYGIACSFVLLMICERKNRALFENKIVRFISSHSMWIYLWHIFVLTVYEKLKLPEIWFIKLIVVYIISSVIVMIINKLLDCLERRHHLSCIKYLRG